MNFSDKDIKLIVENVSNTEEGLKFIFILLTKFGAFERGCNFQNTNMEYYNRGKREQGLWLLDLLENSNFNKFNEIYKLRRKDYDRTRNDRTRNDESRSEE